MSLFGCFGNKKQKKIQASTMKNSQPAQLQNDGGAQYSFSSTDVNSDRSDYMDQSQLRGLQTNQTKAIEFQVSEQILQKLQLARDQHFQEIQCEKLDFTSKQDYEDYLEFSKGSKEPVSTIGALKYRQLISKSCWSTN